MPRQPPPDSDSVGPRPGPRPAPGTVSSAGGRAALARDRATVTVGHSRAPGDSIKHSEALVQAGSSPAQRAAGKAYSCKALATGTAVTTAAQSRPQCYTASIRLSRAPYICAYRTILVSKWIENNFLRRAAMILQLFLGSSTFSRPLIKSLFHGL